MMGQKPVRLLVVFLLRFSSSFLFTADIWSRLLDSVSTSGCLWQARDVLMLRRGWTHTIRRWCAITQGCMHTCLIYNANIFFYCGNGADCAKPRCLISVFDRGSCELSLRRPGDSPPVNAVKQNRSPTWKHSFRESKCCLLFTRSSKTAFKQMATGHKS